MKQKLTCTLVMISLVFLFTSCAAQRGNLSWSNLTPKGKAAFALSIYNTEFDNYLMHVKRPDLTEEEKKVLRVKKKILVAMKPVLDSYAAYVALGQLPPMELERKLLDLITQLEVERRR